MWPAGVLRHKTRSRNVPMVEIDLALQGATGPSRADWTTLEAPVVLSTTLSPGQSFGWKRLAVSEEAYLGVMGNSVVLFVQSEKSIRWCTLAGPGVTCQRVRSFLGLDGPLQDLRSAWAKSCTRLAQVAECLPGLCVLQQDLVETIFGFICSQNNNVSRICLLMDRLRATYGELLCSIAPGVDAEGDGDLAVLREFNVQRKLYAFPSVARLAAASESSLKALGLGYRAAYVRSAAKMLLQKDGCMLKWLEQSRDSIDLSGIDPLQTEEPEGMRQRRLEVRKELCRLPGVGPKVADCIALFAMKQHGSVPVDVHIWQIVTRDYEPELREAKSLTPLVYERVGNAFRHRFGAPFAGWAHSLLFGAEFGALRAQLPTQMLKEMDAYREEIKAQKLKKRKALRKSDKTGPGNSKERDRLKMKRPNTNR
ncbi:unnamed protein product, partial [Durusdinium trenchii]